MDNLEDQRQAKIKRNQDRLEQLGILYKPPSQHASRAIKAPPNKRRRHQSASLPSRSSTRIASAPVPPSYAEQDEQVDSIPRRKFKQKNGTLHVKEDDETEVLPKKHIDTIRAGWTSWKPLGLPPTQNEDSNFHFPDHPTFTPNVSPEEMLREGCFGGSYFRPLSSRKLGTTIIDDCCV